MPDEKDLLGAGLIVAGIGVLIAHHRAEETPIEMGDGSFRIRSNRQWGDEHDDYRDQKFFRHPTNRLWTRVEVYANGRVFDDPLHLSTLPNRQRKIVLTVKYGTVSTVSCESNQRGRSVFIGVDPDDFPTHYSPTAYEWIHDNPDLKISSVVVTRNGRRWWSDPIDNSYPVKVRVVCG